MSTEENKALVQQMIRLIAQFLPKLGLLRNFADQRCGIITA